MALPSPWFWSEKWGRIVGLLMESIQSFLRGVHLLSRGTLFSPIMDCVGFVLAECIWLCFLAWLVVGFLSWILSVYATVFLMGLCATTSALRGNSWSRRFLTSKALFLGVRLGTLSSCPCLALLSLPFFWELLVSWWSFCIFLSLF